MKHHHHNHAAAASVQRPWGVHVVAAGRGAATHAATRRIVGVVASVAAASCATRPRRRHRCGLLPPVRAVGKDGGGGGGGKDEDGAESSIDELAAMLSRRAAEMRASASGSDLPSLEDLEGREGDAEDGDDDAESASSSSSSSRPTPNNSRSSFDDSIPSTSSSIGSGGAPGPLPPARPMPRSDNGFNATEFQVFKTLGQLAVAADAGAGKGTGTDGGDGALGALQPVFVYAARYYSGLPFEGPTTVLLKEYQSPSASVAANEVSALSRLLGPVPERKWAAAVADAAPDPPVVQLLGWLEAPPSDAAYEMTGDNADAAWLVYKFEGLKPLSVVLPRLQPPPAPQGMQALLQGGRAAAAAAATAARVRLLRAFAGRLLGALSFCHARGVAHCSLGAGSVQVSNFEDKSVDCLIVKLDNWGLARTYSSPLEAPQPGGGVGSGSGSGSSGSSGSKSSSGSKLLPDDDYLPPPPPLAVADSDSDASQQRRADLQAAALLLIEVFAAATAGGQEAEAALGGGEALRRLVFEVFHDDVGGQFRGYCAADESLAPFVDYADDTGAWGLLQDLVRGDVAAGDLLRNSRFFFDVAAGGME